MYSFNYRWYFSQENFVSAWWSYFFSGEESNKRILALHWHFKNAKNINICLDQKCHYSSVWYFKIRTFHSKSIQQKLDFPHSWKTSFQKALSVPSWNNCGHRCPHVSGVPRMSWVRGTCHSSLTGHLHSVYAVSPSSTTENNITPSQAFTPLIWAEELQICQDVELWAGRRRDMQYPLSFRTANRQNRQHSPYNEPIQMSTYSTYRWFCNAKAQND